MLFRSAYECSYYTVVNDTFTFELNGKTWHNHPVSDHYGIFAKVTCVKPAMPFIKDDTKLVDHKATISKTKPDGLLPKITDGIGITSTFNATNTKNALTNLLLDDESNTTISVSGSKHGYWEIKLSPEADTNLKLNGVSITTAGSNHPFNMRVFVSMDDKSWEQVGSAYAEKLENSTTYYIKSEEILYTHYVKIAFTDTQNLAKLCNISLYAETVGNGRIKPSQITVTEGPSLGESEGCQNLFDNQTSTKFYTRQYSDGSVPSNPDPLDAIYFTIDKPVTITSYNMVNANDTSKFTGRLPRQWTLYGSTDGVTYVEIDNETKPSLTTDNYDINSFTVDNPGAYQYYKLVFVVGTTGNVQFSEMELFETIS